MTEAMNSFPRQMIRSAALLLMVTAAIGAAGCGPEEQASAPPIESGPPFEVVEYPPRPVVVIVIDTLRADHLGTYGYFRDTSPAIDRVAAEAVVFERVVTTMSTTLPAHVSLWTSRYPMQTGVVANGSKFNVPADGSIRFFAQMLKDQGYTTAAFVSAAPVKDRTGLGAGFDSYDNPEGGQQPAGTTTDRVMEWLANPPAEPFFLWVHYFDPHLPHEPPVEFASLYETDAELIRFLEEKDFPDPTDPAVQQMNNLYDAEIRYTDSQIARVLDRLRELGLYEESTVVILSDHGEALGQHDWEHHGRIYNEQLYVPWILKLPAGRGVPAQRINRLTSLVDVIPTLIDALGLPISEADRAQMEGVNALDLATPRQFAFSQRTFAPREKQWGPGQKFSLMSRDWKYLFATEAEDELFDLRTDPNEIENVIGRNPREYRALQRELRSLLASYAEDSHGLKVIEEKSPETLKELRALGYIQ